MQFNIVICGLDSVDARRWISATLVNMVDPEVPESLKPLIDGGTEGECSACVCDYSSELNHRVVNRQASRARLVSFSRPSPLATNAPSTCSLLLPPSPFAPLPTPLDFPSTALNGLASWSGLESSKVSVSSSFCFSAMSSS